VAEIRIEGKVAIGFGDHLYLVLVDDDGNEFVIRGGPASDILPGFSNIVTEQGVPMALSEDERPIENRADFGSRVIDIGERNAEDVWETMIKASKLIQDAGIDYDIFGPNSNSTVASVLHAVGIDVNSFQPNVPGIDFFPGINDDLLDDYSRVFLQENTSSGIDILWGGDLDDRFEGRGGDDLIDGGAGVGDSALYTGTFSEYDISFNLDGTVTIADTVNDRDGTDTLTGVEFAEFSGGAGGKTNLQPGQDIAFVIDTTGSMFDDIDAVKSQASAIINAIFNPERGLLNSRVAVVGYNDPSTSTFLSFTDQPMVENRQSAAISAINSISVGGGGDEPEVTFAGLLRALNGGAGEWREEAVARKIILFGDAPAKDADLASQVYRLAADLNVTIASPVTASTAIGEGISMVSFATSSIDPATGEERVVPVQIFTIAIGASASTIAEFAEIAETTGGSAFSAADASEIVDALLEVINLPIFSIRANAASVAEGNEGTRTLTFTIERDLADDAAIVTLSLGGTASSDDLGSFPDQIAFAAGESSKTFSLELIGDRTVESDETIVVTMTGVNIPATIGIASATTVIENDDVAVTIIDGSNLGESLPGTVGPDIIDAKGGDDIVSPLSGDDTITLGAGKDKLTGTLPELLGDTVTDFGVDDEIIVQDQALKRAAFVHDASTGKLGIDGDDDGTIDGALTLQGDFSLGDFMAVVGGLDTHITFERFLPTLSEKSSVDSASINGVANPLFLTGDGTKEYKVALDSAAAAGNDNTLGVYEIDGSGAIVDVRILVKSIHDTPSATAMVTGIEAGHQLGFFLVQDGADWARALSGSDAFSFVNASGAGASISDGADIFLAVNGVNADEIVFHSYAKSLNSDGLDHVLSGVSPGGASMNLGFEDLLGGGDNDFQDVLFEVSMI
jgi:hypothetical protein